MTIPSASYPLASSSTPSTTPKTIYDVFLILRDALKAKGVQFGEFVYGPPLVGLAVGATRMTFERDYAAGDQLVEARKNGTGIAGRWNSCVIRIYAHSTKKGPARHDHEDLADRLHEQVHVELYKIIGKRVLTEWRVTGANFVERNDTSDGWAGVLFEFRFQIRSSIADVSWVTGEGADTFEMAADTTQSTLDASGPVAGGELPGATVRN